MSVSWVTLPDSWDIGNVRAVLAFLINVLCAIGIWVVSYAAWRSGAAAAAEPSRPKTKLLSFLSLGGLGDVADVLPLLRFDMGIGLFTKLALQCLIVSLLSLTAIVSGPIARYSTRPTTVVKQTTVSGWLATSNFETMSTAQVTWNNTIERLEAADFPLDQLLDFLPDIKVDWKYDASQWNSSWALDCQYKEETPIELNVTGNYSDPIFVAIPALTSAFPAEVVGSAAYNITTDMAGANEAEDDGTIRWLDALLFVVAQSNPELAYAAEPAVAETGRQLNYLPFDLHIAAFRMHNFSGAVTRFRSIDIGPGPVGAASYTRASCAIARRPGRAPADLDEDPDWHVAFPWVTDIWGLPTMFAENYRESIMGASFTGASVAPPTSRDLARFYQAYMIDKDTQYRETVSRVLNAAHPTVELAIAALVVLLCYVALLGTVLAWVVLGKAVGQGAVIPRTKVEWMMQGVKEVGGREVAAGYYGATWSQVRPDLRTTAYWDARRGQGSQFGAIVVENAAGVRRWDSRLQGAEASVDDAGNDKRTESLD